MQKTIAFFDFDGTITTSDTMLELIKFAKGKPAYYLGMIILSPYLIALKCGLVTATAAKEKLLSLFFGKIPLNEFNNTCTEFSDKILPGLIRRAALNKIKEHQDNNDEVVVVCASAENWISQWCLRNNINYLATRLEVINGKLSGKLSGPNCNGEEKAIKIRSAYDLSQYDEIYAYGDSSGDKAMLGLATKSFYKPFRQ